MKKLYLLVSVLSASALMAKPERKNNSQNVRFNPLTGALAARLSARQGLVVILSGNAVTARLNSARQIRDNKDAATTKEILPR